VSGAMTTMRSEWEGVMRGRVQEARHGVFPGPLVGFP
jgi:hypothetical protein